MSIARRLIILLVAMFTALVTLGGIAAVGMRSSSQRIGWINTNVMPSMVAINELATQFQEMRVYIYRHVMVKSEADKADAESSITAARAVMETNLEKYRKDLVADDRDVELIKTDEAKLRAYFEMLDRVLASSKSGDSAKALDQLGEGRAIAEAAAQALNAHVAYNVNLANSATESAQQEVNRWVWISVATLLLAIAGGGFLGFTTYRRVTGSLSAFRTTIADIANRLDFSQRARTNGNDEIAVTAKGFNSLIEKLQGSLRTMRSSAEQVGEASTALSVMAKQVSDGSGDQSESAASMAAAIEELTVSIQHVASRADQTNELASSAGQVAKEGAETIGKTLNGIREVEDAVKQAAEIIRRLGEDSAKVNAVLAIIRDVADQTNLLALNAAIEAARAGEQGRGFAVVADEVRQLAERTANSTLQITTTMTDMQKGASDAVQGMMMAVEKVDRGVGYAGEAESAIREIQVGSNQTLAMVLEISEALREQTAASTIIAQQVERIAQMSDQNNSASHSAAASADQLSAVAHQMRTESENYTV